jgi:hypothetical protein
MRVHCSEYPGFGLRLLRCLYQCIFKTCIESESYGAAFGVWRRFNFPRTTLDSIDPFHRASIELCLARMQGTGRAGMNDNVAICLANWQNDRMKFRVKQRLI